MATKTTRKIVKIDPDKCNGCGLCVPNCAEGAIQIIDDKAVLVADNLCDGIGDCLGACPKDAITIEERPADQFDPAAVEAKKHHGEKTPDLPCGCPGTMARMFDKEAPSVPVPSETPHSALGHWPVQLMLLPVQGQMWQGADVLISADCVAYAMGDFHSRLLAGKTVAVGCPKLDDLNCYLEKLTEIFSCNDIKSVTVARMEVPCCGGIVVAAEEALQRSCKTNIPFKVLIVGVDGSVKNES